MKKKKILVWLFLIVLTFALGACVITPAEQVTELIITRESIKESYIVGDTLDVSKISISAKYNTGAVKPVEFKPELLTGFNTERPGNFSCIFSYSGLTQTLTYEVKEIFYDPDSGISYENIIADAGGLGNALKAAAGKNIKIMVNGELTAEDVLALSVQNGFNYVDMSTIYFPTNTFPSNVFNGSTALTYVVLPDSVTTIESNALKGLTALKCAKIGEKTRYISANPFVDCAMLENIKVHQNNEYYCTIAGVLHNIEGTTLVAYPASKTEQTFTPISTLTKIGVSAFSKNKNIQTLSLGNKVSILDDHSFDGAAITTLELLEGVTQIGAYAFNDCASLTSVNMKNTINMIKEGAFAKCTSLTAINLSANVNSLDQYLFKGCTSLKRVPIANTVRLISSKTFDGANALDFIEVSEANLSYAHVDGVLYTKDKKTLVFYPQGKMNETSSFTISDSATTIKEGAIVGTMLKTILLPASIMKIETNAFQNNKELLQFTVDSKNMYFKADNGILTDKNGKRLVKYPDNKVEVNNSFTIPLAVETVERYAFSGNLRLETVVISSSMKEVYPYVFANMNALKTIKAHASFVGFKESAFHGSNTMEKIELVSLTVNFEKGALDGCNANIKIVATANSSGVEFYGYYSSNELNASALLDCKLSPNVPKTLSTNMLSSAGVKLYTRYGDYETGMSIEKKPTSSEKFGYYVTDKNNSEEVNKFIEAIIANYSINITRMDGVPLFQELTREIIGELTDTDIANPEYIITIQREKLSAQIKVRLKDKDKFTVKYNIESQGVEDCKLQLKTWDNVTQGEGPEGIEVKDVTEGRNDVSFVKAIAAKKMLFDKFKFTAGEKKSDYYDPLVVANGIDGNLRPMITDNSIYFENVICDIVVTVHFVRELDISISSEQFIETHLNVGGNIYYNNELIPENTSVVKSAKYGTGLETITAQPFETFPGAYGDNKDKVHGYRFKDWVFTGEDGGNLEYKKIGEKYIITTGEGDNKKSVVLFKIVNIIEKNIIKTSSIEIENCEINFSVKARFIPYFALTYKAEEGGALIEKIGDAISSELSEITQYVNYGEDANTIMAMRFKNFNFSGWSDNVEGGASRQDVKIIAPATYTAKFTSLLPIKYETITTLADFEKMRENPTGNFILKNNINMGGIQWKPIGTVDIPFAGMFDGSGHTLSNFVIKDEKISGLFGYFTGDVRNLVMSGVTIDSGIKQEIYAGIIAGYMQNGSITNSIVSDCKIAVANSAKASVGGVVGMVHEGVVANCAVQISDFMVGGVQNVFVGGLVGQIDLGEIFNNLTVVRPYIAFSGGDNSSFVGGVVGQSGLPTPNAIRNNYYDSTEVDGMPDKSGYRRPIWSIGLGKHPNNSAKTSEELKNGLMPSSSWSENVWILGSGKYPTINFDIGVIDIFTVADLGKIFSYPTGKFKLVNDIYLTSNWVPISYFAGTFDGNERTIFNVTIIDSNNAGYINSGFFAKLGSGAIINNVGFKDTYIESRAPNANIGGLAGIQSGGLVFGTYVTGTIAIFGCTNTNAGGLIGKMNKEATLHNSYCVMEISSEKGENGILGGAVGLITGELGTKVNIQFSYSMSTVYTKDNKVTGKYNLGGFIGKNASNNSILKNNFYITTTMNAIDESYNRPESIMTGELVGKNPGDVADNYGLTFMDMPSASETMKAPFDKWDKIIWSFSEKGNLNPFLSFETDIFNPEGGDGTSSNPYKIDTYEELKWLKVYNSSGFILTKDIDLTGKDWNPFMFIGTLDGDGYSIIGLNFKQAKKGGAGLFSELGGNTEGGFIKNLNLVNIDFNISDASEDLKIGAIAMKAKASARIENCAVTGKINLNIPRGAIVGGLVGYAVGKQNGLGKESYKFNTSYVNMTLKSTTEIVASGVAGTVPGDDTSITQGLIIAGSMFGMAENTAMKYTNTFGTISVSAMKAEVGGIVGRTFGRSNKGLTLPGIDIRLSNSSVNINVTGRLNSSVSVGGIVGRNYSGGLIVTRCTVRNGAEIAIQDLARPTKEGQNIIAFDFGGILGRLDFTGQSEGTTISTYSQITNNLYDGNIFIPYDSKLDGDTKNKNSILYAGKVGIVTGNSVTHSSNKYDKHMAYKMTKKPECYEVTQAFGTITGQIEDKFIRRDRSVPITVNDLNDGLQEEQDNTYLEFTDPGMHTLSNGDKLSARFSYLGTYPPAYFTLIVSPVREINVGIGFSPEKAVFLQKVASKAIVEESSAVPMLYRPEQYVDTTKPGIYVVNYKYNAGANNMFYAKSIIVVKSL